MPNYIDEITQLQKKIEEAKMEDVRLKERMKSLTEEKNKLLEELKVYEISETDLDGEIAKLDEEIQKELSKCQELMK